MEFGNAPKTVRPKVIGTARPPPLKLAERWPKDGGLYWVVYRNSKDELTTAYGPIDALNPKDIQILKNNGFRVNTKINGMYKPGAYANIDGDKVRRLEIEGVTGASVYTGKPVNSGQAIKPRVPVRIIDGKKYASKKIAPVVGRLPKENGVEFDLDEELPYNELFEYYEPGRKHREVHKYGPGDVAVSRWTNNSVKEYILFRMKEQHPMLGHKSDERSPIQFQKGVLNHLTVVKNQQLVDVLIGIVLARLEHKEEKMRLHYSKEDAHIRIVALDLAMAINALKAVSK